MNEEDARLKEILELAEKQPKSRLSQLIREVMAEPTLRNIAILLKEVEDHLMYSKNFTISLGYYLDLFEQLCSVSDVALNDAGMALVSGSKICSRRVDCVYEMVRDQLLNLSLNCSSKSPNAVEATHNENENGEESNTNATNEQTRRGKRKSHEEVEPLIVPLSTPKKLCKLSVKQRCNGKTEPVRRSIKRRKAAQEALILEMKDTLMIKALFEKAKSDGYHFSKIVKEKQEDVLKSNYNLFLDHIDHPHSSVFSDHKYAVHLIVQDYINALKEKYIKRGKNPPKYIAYWPIVYDGCEPSYFTLLEKAIVWKEKRRKRKLLTAEGASKEFEDYENELEMEISSTSGSGIMNSTITPNESTTSTTNAGDLPSGCPTVPPFANSPDKSVSNDSALGDSILSSNTTSGDMSMESSEHNVGTSNVNEDKELQAKLSEEKEIMPNEMEALPVTECGSTDKNTTNDLEANNENINGDSQSNLNDIRVHLPHLDDEGVYFSDLDEHDQRMLSPSVRALDVLPAVPDKENVTIAVDGEISAMLELSDEAEQSAMPSQNSLKRSLQCNVMKLQEKLLKRRKLFTLGPEFNIHLRTRISKRKLCEEPKQSHDRSKKTKWFRLDNTDFNEFAFNSSSQNSSADFYGFSEVSELNGFSDVGSDMGDLGHRLSRDSGFGLDGTGNAEKSQNTSPQDKRDGDVPEKDETSDKNDNLNKDVSGNVKILENNVNVDVNNDSETVEVGSTEQATAESANVEVGSTEQATAESANVEVGSTEQATAESANVEVGSTEQATAESANVEVGRTEQATAESETVEVGSTEQATAESKTVEVGSTEQATVESQSLSSVEKNTNLSTVSKYISNNTGSAVGGSLNGCNTNIDEANIKKWHEYLKPLLNEARERHHYDIFNLCTKVMKKLEKGKITEATGTTLAKPCISFQDVMQDEDPTYVSRFLFSSLLLANQNNIKIIVENKSSEHPSEKSDIKFELLSTKRQTVSLEDNISLFENEVQPDLLQRPSSSKKSKNSRKSRVSAGRNTEQCEVVNLSGESFAETNGYNSGISSSDEIT